MIFFHKAFGQKVENGVYVGYEQNPFCYTKDCSRDYKENKLRKNELYYKITLQVTDTISSITKISVRYLSKARQEIDSLKGGYYRYEKVDISDNRIFGGLNECKYCTIGGCAQKKFTLIHYRVTQTKKGLLLSNYYEKNIFLKKVK